jgi:hypothetical protein
VARSRGRFAREADEALVAQIIGGASAAEMPPCVREALEMLDERRAGRFTTPA